MKNPLFSFTILMLASCASPAQNSTDLSNIDEAVRAFARGSDQQDAAGLDKVLHPQFRAVVNRAFGSADVSLMDKAAYLQLIRDKKIGGDTRDVHLVQTDITNNIATVKAIFQGKLLRFTTFVSLVKLPDGTWQVVGDMPDIEKV